MKHIAKSISPINIKTIFILFLVYAISSCNPSKKLVQIEPIVEAEAFALEVIETYFNNDCDAFYEKISDEVFTLDGNGIIKKAEIKDKICTSIEDAIINKEKSFQDYLNDYDTEMLTIPEVETRFKIKMPDYYVPDKSDLLFLGFTLKDEKTENYIWDDMFTFFIRKENGKWTVKGGE